MLLRVMILETLVVNAAATKCVIEYCQTITRVQYTTHSYFLYIFSSVVLNHP